MAICRCFDPLGRPWPKIPKQPTRGAAGHFYIVLCHWQIRIWTAWDSGSSNRWMGPWYSLAMVLSTSCWGRVFLGKKTSILRVLSLRTRRTWKPINIGGFYPLRQNKRIEGQQRRERSSKLAKLADYYFALLSLARVSLEAQTRVQGVFFSRPAWRTPDHGS